MLDKRRKKKVVKKKKVPQKITHTWDTFTRFEEIGLGEPPITASAIPAAIEQVRVKLSEWQKKSKEEKVEILKLLEQEELEERKLEEQKKLVALQREKEDKENKTEAPKEVPKEEGTTTKDN